MHKGQAHIYGIVKPINGLLTHAFSSYHHSFKLRVLFCIKRGVLSGGSRAGGRDVRPPPPPPPIKEKKREREREGGRSSVPLLSISAFIHSPVKCNKSLYIFTRCIALLVYLITFEAVDD